MLLLLLVFLVFLSLQMTGFSCHICMKSLSSSSSLRTHMKLHQGQYNYNCPTCNKGFTSKSMLRGHMSWHTGIKEFRCPLCSKEMRYQHEVKIHLRKKHARNPPLVWLRLSFTVPRSATSGILCSYKMYASRRHCCDLMYWVFLVFVVAFGDQPVHFVVNNSLFACLLIKSVIFLVCLFDATFLAVGNPRS